MDKGEIYNKLAVLDLPNDRDPIKESEEAETIEQLQQVKNVYLGRKGFLRQAFERIGSIPPSERPAYGAKLNKAKEAIEKLFKDQQARLARPLTSGGLLDVTLPGKSFSIGSLHPITHVLREVVNIFRSMGFEVCDGPEIETEFYNFDALNIPANHPARDLWDTFFLINGMVPRTHTSSVQIRVLEKRKPPLRIIAPGRCYRYETVDATHLAIFNQVEGLVISDDIRLSHLKWTLETFVQQLFGKDIKTRFRPAFYPFVEPGLDLDIQCPFCQTTSSCAVCKGSGWIEIIPCGLVHPTVIQNCGHDPESWQGFAFGMGFDRLVMLRYNIDDMRLLYDGDLRTLLQFDRA